MNASAASFAISVQTSGIQFEAQPGESLLAAGIRQGIGLPYGCKDGACGSCKCKLVSGQVAQSNFQRKALSEDEEAQGFVLTCSAKALSDITLESRQVTPAGALPVKKMPTRVSSLTRKTDDVMVMQLQLPANDTFVYCIGVDAARLIYTWTIGCARRATPCRTCTMCLWCPMPCRKTPGKDVPVLYTARY